MTHHIGISHRRPTRSCLPSLAMAVALASAFLATEGAPPARAGNADATTIRICNDSGHDATVAIVYVPVGEDQFLNEGWFDVGADDCRDLADTDNRTFYVYAEATDDSNRVWTGDHGECVMYPGPYRFWSTDDDTCDSDEDLRDFDEVEVDQGTDTLVYRLRD